MSEQYPIFLPDPPGSPSSPVPAPGGSYISWDADAVYTYYNGNWGKSPRTIVHWDEIDQDARFLLLNKTQELSLVEKSNALLSLGIERAYIIGELFDEDANYGLCKYTNDWRDSGTGDPEEYPLTLTRYAIVHLFGEMITEYGGSIFQYAQEAKDAALSAEASAQRAEEAAEKASQFYGGYSRLMPVEDYLYEVWYNTLDYKYAFDYFSTQDIDPNVGGCTAVRSGSVYGRNYDWTYDDKAEFLVHTSALDGRHAVLGMATNVPELTDEFVKSWQSSEMYKLVPFRMVDGINDAGLVMNVNVVPVLDKTDPYKNRHINYSPDHKITLCLSMLIRFVLDNFSTVDEAIGYITDNVNLYYSTNFLREHLYEYHYMIADNTGVTKCIEFIDGAIVPIDISAHPYITNFHVGGVLWNSSTSKIVNTPIDTLKPGDKNHIEDYGAGLERCNTVANGYKAAENDVEKMKALMLSVFYSRAYNGNPWEDPTDQNRWYTEFVGDFNSIVPGLDLTVNSDKEDFAGIVAYSDNLFENKQRTGMLTSVWLTTHSVVYDIARLEVHLFVQEAAKSRAHLATGYHKRTVDLGGGGVIIDPVPTEGSGNAVSSGGVYDALGGRTKLEYEDAPVEGSQKIATSNSAYKAYDSYPVVVSPVGEGPVSDFAYNVNIIAVTSYWVDILVNNTDKVYILDIQLKCCTDSSKSFQNVYLEISSDWFFGNHTVRSKNTQSSVPNLWCKWEFQEDPCFTALPYGELFIRLVDASGNIKVPYCQCYTKRLTGDNTRVFSGSSYVSNIPVLKISGYSLVNGAILGTKTQLKLEQPRSTGKDNFDVVVMSKDLIRSGKLSQIQFRNSNSPVATPIYIGVYQKPTPYSLEEDPLKWDRLGISVNTQQGVADEFSRWFFKDVTLKGDRPVAFICMQSHHQDTPGGVQFSGRTRDRDDSDTASYIEWSRRTPTIWTANKVIEHRLFFDVDVFDEIGNVVSTKQDILLSINAGQNVAIRDKGTEYENRPEIVAAGFGGQLDCDLIVGNGLDGQRAACLLSVGNPLAAGLLLVKAPGETEFKNLATFDLKGHRTVEGLANDLNHEVDCKAFQDIAVASVHPGGFLKITLKQAGSQGNNYVFKTGSPASYDEKVQFPCFGEDIVQQGSLIPGRDAQTDYDITVNGYTVRTTEDLTKTDTDIDNALAGKEDKLTWDEFPVQDSSNPVTSGGVYKQMGQMYKVVLTSGASAPEDIIVASNTIALHKYWADEIINTLSPAVIRSIEFRAADTKGTLLQDVYMLISTLYYFDSLVVRSVNKLSQVARLWLVWEFPEGTKFMAMPYDCLFIRFVDEQGQVKTLCGLTYQSRMQGDDSRIFRITGQEERYSYTPLLKVNISKDASTEVGTKQGLYKLESPAIGNNEDLFNIFVLSGSTIKSGMIHSVYLAGKYYPPANSVYLGIFLKTQDSQGDDPLTWTKLGVSTNQFMASGADKAYRWNFNGVKVTAGNPVAFITMESYNAAPGGPVIGCFTRARGSEDLESYIRNSENTNKITRVPKYTIEFEYDVIGEIAKKQPMLPYDWIVNLNMIDQGYLWFSLDPSNPTGMMAHDSAFSGSEWGDPTAIMMWTGSQQTGVDCSDSNGIIFFTSSGLPPIWYNNGPNVPEGESRIHVVLTDRDVDPTAIPAIANRVTTLENTTVPAVANRVTELEEEVPHKQDLYKEASAAGGGSDNYDIMVLSPAKLKKGKIRFMSFKFDNQPVGTALYLGVFQRAAGSTEGDPRNWQRIGVSSNSVRGTAGSIGVWKFDGVSIDGDLPVAFITMTSSSGTAGGTQIRTKTANAGGDSNCYVRWTGDGWTSNNKTAEHILEIEPDYFSLLDGKQDRLTAGHGIAIDGNNVISAAVPTPESTIPAVLRHGHVYTVAVASGTVDLSAKTVEQGATAELYIDYTGGTLKLPSWWWLDGMSSAEGDHDIPPWGQDMEANHRYVVVVRNDGRKTVANLAYDYPL